MFRDVDVDDSPALVAEQTKTKSMRRWASVAVKKSIDTSVAT